MIFGSHAVPAESQREYLHKSDRDQSLATFYSDRHIAVLLAMRGGKLATKAVNPVFILIRD